MPKARSGLAGTGSLRFDAQQERGREAPLSDQPEHRCFRRQAVLLDYPTVKVVAQLDFTASTGRCKTARSGLGTRLSLAALEVAAGAVIAARPSCPPGASRAVDRLTLLRDRLQEVAR